MRPPAAAVTRLSLLCPAKINLHLCVGPRRADGFHPLLSWMCTVGLFDTLELETAADVWSGPGGGRESAPGRGRASIGVSAEEEAPPPPPPPSPVLPQQRAGAPAMSGATGGPDVLVLESDLPGLPCDRRNLVVRVAAEWAEALGHGVGRYDAREPGGEQGSGGVGRGPAGQGTVGAGGGRESARVIGARARLHKRIPVGGGLGGGSSDAARTLLGLNRLWHAGAAAEDLSAFAARFGSDLPFFFHGPSAVCTGRGEVVRPVPRPAPRWAVLVLPGVEMPTAAVYRRFDELGLGGSDFAGLGAAGEVAPQQPDWREWAALGAVPLLRRLVNDLEPAAFSLDPRLGELRLAAESQLGRPVRMSGSGSSLFTLYDARDEASDAAESVEAAHGVQALAVEMAPELMDDLGGSPVQGSGWPCAR